MDIRALQTERKLLRKFCLHQGTAAIGVIRDLTGRGLEDPRNDPAVRVAEWLLFSLTVDAARFADPEDGCDDMAPSVFAIPSAPSTKPDVAAALDANRGPMPFIVDYRMGEALWPLFGLHRAVNTLQQIRIWDRGLRQRRRIGALVTRDAVVDSFAIAFDGSYVLRRRNGVTLDVGSSFWRAATWEISRQRCVQPDQWRHRDFKTEGNA